MPNRFADVKFISQLRVLDDIGLFDKWITSASFVGLVRKSKLNGTEMLVVIIIITMMRIFQQDKSFNKNIAGFNACPA